MRTKSLSIIASFFILSLAITSCLDSDNDYELSSDNTISAFALDTIYGVTYKFTIDQQQGLIYNVDSVPYSADTIINKILIKTFTVGGYVTAGETAEKDTFFNYTDSIDFSNTMVIDGKDNRLVLRIRPEDGSDYKEYKIEVRRHLTDPDSLVWSGGEAYIKSFSGGAVTSNHKTKTVALNEKILVFTSEADNTNPQLYKEWNGPTNLVPNNLIISSVITYRDKLYTTSSDGKVFSSSDGINWTAATTDGTEVSSLLTTFYGTENGNSIETAIAGIVKIESVLYFAKGTFDADQKLSWATEKQPVPVSDSEQYLFPTENITATKSTKTATGGQIAYLIGASTSDSEPALPWFSKDGLSWAPMPAQFDNNALPSMKYPSIMYYGDKLYVFGDNLKNTADGFSSFYTSLNGFAWQAVEKKFLFPVNINENVFKGRTNYSMTIDSDNYIWIVWGKNGSSYNDDVWRGKLNRLGFLIQ